MRRHVRELRKNPTNAERLLWNHLRRRQIAGIKFRRQHQIGLYICDFASLEASLVIELDGSQHATQIAYDSRRDHFLRSAGFRVLRFWNGDVLHRTEQVLETIFEALHHLEMDGRLDDPSAPTGHQGAFGRKRPKRPPISMGRRRGKRLTHHPLC